MGKIMPKKYFKSDFEIKDLPELRFSMNADVHRANNIKPYLMRYVDSTTEKLKMAYSECTESIKNYKEQVDTLTHREALLNSIDRSALPRNFQLVFDLERIELGRRIAGLMDRIRDQKAKRKGIDKQFYELMEARAAYPPEDDDEFWSNFRDELDIIRKHLLSTEEDGDAEGEITKNKGVKRNE